MKKLSLILLSLGVLCSPAQGKEKIVAKINGKVITESQLNQAVKSLPPYYKNLPNARKLVLENLIKEEVLYSEALKENLEKNPQVRKAIEEAKKKILIAYLLKKHVKIPKIEISDQEVRNFYEKNKKAFSMNGKPIEFDSLKSKLKEVLLENKRKEAYIKALNNYVAKLMKENKVEVFLNQK